jgi:hypothetical protein
MERSDGSDGKALRPGPVVADKTRRLARCVAEKPRPSAILLIDILRQKVATKKNPKQSTHLGSWKVCCLVSFWAGRRVSGDIGVPPGSAYNMRI